LCRYTAAAAEKAAAEAEADTARLLAEQAAAHAEAAAECVVRERVQRAEAIDEEGALQVCVQLTTKTKLSAIQHRDN
jgi:hypothetical protein